MKAKPQAQSAAAQSAAAAASPTVSTPELAPTCCYSHVSAVPVKSSVTCWCAVWRPEISIRIEKYRRLLIEKLERLAELNSELASTSPADGPSVSATLPYISQEHLAHCAIRAVLLRSEQQPHQHQLTHTHTSLIRSTDEPLDQAQQQ